jgi:hypothetical protein
MHNNLRVSCRTKGCSSKKYQNCPFKHVGRSGTNCQPNHLTCDVRKCGLNDNLSIIQFISYSYTKSYNRVFNYCDNEYNERFDNNVNNCKS